MDTQGSLAAATKLWEGFGRDVGRDVSGTEHRWDGKYRSRKVAMGQQQSIGYGHDEYIHRKKYNAAAAGG